MKERLKIVRECTLTKEAVSYDKFCAQKLRLLPRFCVTTFLFK